MTATHDAAGPIRPGAHVVVSCKDPAILRFAEGAGSLAPLKGGSGFGPRLFDIVNRRKRNVDGGVPRDRGLQGNGPKETSAVDVLIKPTGSRQRTVCLGLVNASRPFSRDNLSNLRV